MRAPLGLPWSPLVFLGVSDFWVHAIIKYFWRVCAEEKRVPRVYPGVPYGTPPLRSGWVKFRRAPDLTNYVFQGNFFAGAGKNMLHFWCFSMFLHWKCNIAILMFFQCFFIENATCMLHVWCFLFFFVFMILLYFLCLFDAFLMHFWCCFSVFLQL